MREEVKRSAQSLVMFFLRKCCDGSSLLNYSSLEYFICIEIALDYGGLAPRFEGIYINVLFQ
jgi:uncharacterized protein (DUF779 family)